MSTDQLRPPHHAHFGLGRIALLISPSAKARRWRLHHTLLVAGFVVAVAGMSLVATALVSPRRPAADSSRAPAATPQQAKAPILIPATTEPPPAPAATPTPSPTPKTTVATPPSPTPTAPPIPTPPNCTKGSYTPANALTISATSTSSTGLKIVDDSPQYYQVYGYTADQIRSQLSMCRPSDKDGDANVNWWLNFSYWTASDGAGKCYVSQTAVGLHLSEFFPVWSTSSYDSAGLASKWQAYTTNLQTHMQGHKDLAKQYATDLYNGLKNYPHTSCSTIISAVNQYGNNKVAALQQASDTYDTQTNHGATQGAVFP